jgi:hypothetical protein
MLLLAVTGLFSCPAFGRLLMCQLQSRDAWFTCGRLYPLAAPQRVPLELTHNKKSPKSGKAPP